MTQHRLSWHLYSSKVNLRRGSSWPFSSVKLSDTGISILSPGFRYLISQDDIVAIDWCRCFFSEIRVKFNMKDRYDRLRLHCFRVDALLNDFASYAFSQIPRYNPDLPIFWGHTD